MPPWRELKVARREVHSRVHPRAAWVSCVGSSGDVLGIVTVRAVKKRGALHSLVICLMHSNSRRYISGHL